MEYLEIFNFWIMVVGVTGGVLIGWPLLFGGALWLPSFHNKNKKRIEELVKFIKNKGVTRVIDLGSGDGRVVLALAEAGLESYGVEINPFLVWWSRVKIKAQGYKKAYIKWGNFWKEDLSRFEAVFLFQFKLANNQLEKKLLRELKSNTLIISVGFPLENFTLIKKTGQFFVYKK